MPYNCNIYTNIYRKSIRLISASVGLIPKQGEFINNDSTSVDIFSINMRHNLSETSQISPGLSWPSAGLESVPRIPDVCMLTNTVE